MQIIVHVVLDPSLDSTSVFSEVWRIKIPEEIKFFIWQVLLGHVNMM